MQVELLELSARIVTRSRKGKTTKPVWGNKNPTILVQQKQVPLPLPTTKPLNKDSSFTLISPLSQRNVFAQSTEEHVLLALGRSFP